MKKKPTTKEEKPHVNHRGSKTVKASQATFSALMMPSDQNFFGFIFGGVILKMMDHIAYVCARKHSSSNCITASFDRVDFKEPIHVGELVTMVASINYVGRSSMEIGIKVYAEDLKTGKTRHTNTSYVTMVAIDEKGNPHPVPRLIPETAEEKRRYAEAEKRYLARKKSAMRRRK